jgi:hypothetical protein
MTFIRAIRKGLVWCAVAALCCSVGVTLDRVYLRQSSFRVINTKVEVDTGSAQLVVNTLIRKREVMGVPLYCILLRDNRSGKELPLVTLEDTFQEASIAPRLVEHDADHATFSAGKGTIEIRLPNTKIQGLSEEPGYFGRPAVYLGPPKE